MKRKNTQFSEEQEENQGKLMDFLDKQGFYVVLALCLLVIAITAIVTLGGGNGNQTALENGTQNANNNIGNGATASPYVFSWIPEEDLDVAAEDTEVLEEDANAANAKAAEKVELQRPVDGEVIRPFAKDVLVYNNTLKQWSTHLGIDIAAIENTEVKAVDAGTVESAKEDVMMGYVVTIKHENGAKSVYANLSKDSLINQGTKVKKGQIIGKVGRSAIAEFDDEAHLHFEYIKSDAAVNPLDYMSGLKVRTVEEKPIETSAPVATPNA